MRRGIVPLGSPILRTPPPFIKGDEFNTGALVEQLSQMGDMMRAAGGVGLASTQIGWFRRAFVFEAEGRHGAICNPAIVERSDELVPALEGCLSIRGLECQVFRARAVTLIGFTPTGEEQELKAKGLVARIFQHEVDHLDGALIIDRTVGLARAQTFERIREHDAAIAVSETAR